MLWLMLWLYSGWLSLWLCSCWLSLWLCSCWLSLWLCTCWLCSGCVAAGCRSGCVAAGCALAVWLLPTLWLVDAADGRSGWLMLLTDALADVYEEEMDQKKV